MTNLIDMCPFWWKKKTALEKSLFLAIFILLLTSFILFLVITRIYSTESNKCRSPVCIKSSSIILNRMNNSVNPCDDFYEFACGKFLKEKFVPFTETEIDIEKEILSTVEMEIIELLDYSKNETEAFGKAQQFFKACMNESQIRRQGFEPLHRVFNLIGGWPILEGDKWNEQTFDWIEVLKKLKQFGLYRNYLIEVYSKVIRIANDNNMPANFIGKNLTNEDFRAIGELIANYVEILGGDKKSQSVQKNILDLLKFYRSFVEISPKITKLEWLSVAKMQEKYRNIRWLDFLKIEESAINVDNDTIFIDLVPVAMEEFDRLLEHTSKRAIANYLSWKVLEETLDMLPIDLFEAKSLYQLQTAGRYDGPLRWQTCVKKVIKYFAPTILSMYKKKYLKEESLNELNEIKKNIQTTIREVLQPVDLKHLNYLKTNILRTTISMNIPKELSNISYVDNLYRDVEINENAYFELEINLRRELSKSKWIIDTIKKYSNYFYKMVESYFEKLDDMEIALSPCLFQNLLFTKGRPTSMNYAIVGYSVGFMTALQAKVLIQSVPEKIAGGEAYVKQNQCLKEQYDMFNYSDITNTGFSLDGVVLYEFDNLAIQIAYTAYTKWTNQHQEGDLQLYGIPYSSRQLFWINYAQFQCHKTKIQTATPTFRKSQVMSALRISKEFNRDFQCPFGSYMNLKHKCKCITSLC